MFQNFGLVETSRIIRHGRTMVSKGYGFVKFSEPSQVSSSSELLLCITLVVQCVDQQPSDGAVHSCCQQFAGCNLFESVWSLCSHRYLIQHSSLQLSYLTPWSCLQKSNAACLSASLRMASQRTQ